jgi:DNA-binding transcriptional MocR family regulator
MTGLAQYQISAGNAAELVRNVEGAVARGDLLPGQRLPPVRRLAAELGLSPVTVSAGFAELRRRGVVLSEPRRGTRIGQAPPIGSARPVVPVPAGACDLSRGNPDPALLPDLRRALRGAAAPTRLYGEPATLPQLAALARMQLDADGLDGAALCVVSGALDAIERVLLAHLRVGDRVAVENPGYAALFDLLRAQGLVPAGVELDDRGMLPASLEATLQAGARAIVVTPRGQNPTGATLDAARARELRRVLGRFPETLLIEDDHLGAAAGARMHTLTRGRERWAATRSVAKALGPDLRLAVLCGDPETVARVQGRQQCGPGWVSHILQRLVVELWQDEAVARAVARAAAVYDARRSALLDALGRRGVGARGASGLNVWIPVADEAAAVAALLQRGWVVASGAAYRLQGAAPGIRATTAALKQDDAERLAQDIAAVLDPAAASRSG